MYNLETLLSIQKKRDNSNKKFPNSSNRKVYDRLQIDFDFDPSIIILSDAAKEHLNNMPKFIRDWEAEDMRNDNVKDYYKNPVGDATNVIRNIANRIIDLVTYIVEQPTEGVPLPAIKKIVSGLEGVYNAAVNLQGVSCEFLCHTNRLSNVVPIHGPCTGPPCNMFARSTDPHYLTCSALNRTILYLVHETDGISDARPILGTFTSLLILDELIASGVKIILYPDMIEKSIKGFAYETEAGFYSDLLESEKIEIIFTLNNIASSLSERVEHDKRVWRNVKMLNEEQNVFKVINEMGLTQTRLVRDYIGTDKLKQSLLIADLPSLKYDVIIDYFGNVDLKPNTKWTMPPDANTPTSILDDYFDYYSNNRIEFEPPPDDEGNTIYSLEVFPGALIFNTENGLWSNNQIVTITNVGNTAYSYSNVNFNDFSKTEFRYEFNPANTNIIGVGNSAQFIVAARGIEDEDFVEYGFCKIIPGIDLGIKVINSFDDIGVISPLQIINIYGSEDEKLILNTNNGPYPIVATESPTYNPYTWINNSEYPATISTIENITDSANLSNMTIHFINANTPATLNVTDKVLWYANVIPHITTPNNFTYKITTEDGQERTIILGVYGGNVGGNPPNPGDPTDGVDDSALYNETINTTPDLIIANGQSFIINIANGKPRTAFTYSGPDLNGTATLDANGRYSLVNSDGITSNGYYTYIFTFDGTDRTRTITKAIFT